LIFFYRIINNPFLKNVSTLALGTIISQAIVVAASPLLTRLYSVEAFGMLSLFTSYVVIFSVISTGRYELAIGLPEKDDESKEILKLILILGLSVSFFYLSVIFVLREVFNFSNFELFSSKWVYLAPLYVFFIAIFSGLTYWNQRKKRYKKITIANAIQVISTSFFSLIFGFFFRFEAGMIISLVLGIMVSTFFLIKEFPFSDYKINFYSVKGIAKEYISFPKYLILSDLATTSSQQLIPIAFSVIYSTTIVGFFSLANRMLRLPNIIITVAIANVFRNDAIDEIRKNGNCERLYLSTLKKLVVISTPIYLIIFFVSPILFQFFFGDNWLRAGYFARILSVLLFFEFVATPLNSLFYISNSQKKLMKLQVLNALLGLFMIYLGYKLYQDALWSLVFFSVNSVLFNLVFIYITYKTSMRKDLIL
jgi:teichuronic acid exporter